ncbi:Zn-dependent protease with chaperone function [Jatrophihabitans endophyticus]|uniref:Zn-dependent protease with chaperone function n=1 Tax=Jatrophihabitans endophyticus TaxID=1206085 RepID=A0A1M5C097_9ACTN|nr:M48 family metalloprotease [Jatrophihabitans endophyticus]SHF48168.1 Zn-dependent protease with chaperone function [Jatrophihabitans endophyticus]
MNFFERQRAARGTTVRLVVLFALAVLCIVAVVAAVAWYLTRNGPVGTTVTWVAVAAAFTLAVIGGGTASKLVALRGGGAVVAQSVGAVAVDPTTHDPRLRRLVNVVEEMAIASGVPAPRLFVLEREDGINAFAAGYGTGDAAITVTSGALDRLDRDELQGVIGHEFSHILNGDMRLNVRLLGLLNGILLLGLVGLRFLQFGGGRSRDSKGGNPMLVVALVLLVLGFVGQFFAGLIKAGVSRQREWLADASAVQFTRQTSGLAGALKKIGGLPVGSALHDSHSERQVDHMLFGPGSRSTLYATHPPLTERIAALDPSFRPDELRELQERFAQRPPDGLAEDAAAGLTERAGPAPVANAEVRASTVRLAPADVTARVATVTPDDLARGARLDARLPAELRESAGQPATAVALVLALLLDARDDVREVQLRTVDARLGPSVAAATVRLSAATTRLDPLLALPLVGLAAPQLAARPAAERDAVQAALRELALVDGRVTVFEYALMRVVGVRLADAASPAARSRPGRTTLRSGTDAALTLLAVLAAVGHTDPAAAQHAFHAATTLLLPAATGIAFAPPADPWRALDTGWDVLDALDPRHKQLLVEAMVAAVADDGVLRPAEAELLRAACAVLHCPLPPLVA